MRGEYCERLRTRSESQIARFKIAKRKSIPVSKTFAVLNDLDCVIEELFQSWNDRLDFPRTKIPERYTRLRETVVLKMTCDLGGVKMGMFSLIAFNDPLHLDGVYPRCGTSADNELSMLINNVEVVDNPEEIIKWIGGFVRLESLYKRTDLEVGDSLYFPLKSSTSIRIGGLFVKDRELDFSDVFYSADREMPRNVVEARS
jgi:hypothetical protein